MNTKTSYSLSASAPVKLTYWHYGLLLVCLFIAFFFGIGSYPLENMNDGLYAEIPREMLALGNYLIPHLNYVPYLEKPPLFYWLIALSYSIFGISAVSARLVPALSATVICFALLLAAQALHRPRAGWLAAMILVSSVGFILITRVLLFDVLLTACFTLSLLFFYCWYEHSRQLYLYLAYLFLGLAFMTKGLLAPALIPAIAGSFVLSEPNRWRKLYALFDGIGILLLLVTVLPWVILATWYQPHFFSDFFINEQILRFLDKRVPADYHTGPLYFYLPLLIVYLFPWSLFFTLLFKKSADRTLKPFEKFLWLWFAVSLIFFSLSQAKGDYYMVLGVPPLALLLGIKLDEYGRSGKTLFLTLVLSALIVIGAGALGMLWWAATKPALQAWLPSLPPSYMPTVKLLSFGLIVYGLLSLWLMRRWPYFSLRFALLAGLMMPVVLLYLADKQALQAQRSAAAVADFIKTHSPDRPVYLYRDYEKISTILFYLQRRLPIIDSQSQDLYFGSHSPQAQGWFLTPHAFIRQAEQQQTIYVVMDGQNRQDFTAAVYPQHFCQVYKSGKTILLTNNLQECRPTGRVDE